MEIPRHWHELGPFTVFDLETTGVKAVRDRIVEIAAIRVERNGEVSKFHSLVHPGCPIPPAAFNVHRISDDMVAGSPPFARIGQRFLDFAANSTLVAHNAYFDLSFLQESLARCGLPLWAGKTLDSLRLIKKTHSQLPSYSLQNLRKVFVLEEADCGEKAHRAAADAEWTLAVLRIALSEILKKQQQSS